MNYHNKMKSIVDNELNRVGRDFFNKIDDTMRLNKNLDLVQKVFDNIKNTNKGFNLILTGGFGDWILMNIKKGKLKVPGNLLLVNGSIRGKDNKLNKLTTGKRVEIIYKKNDDLQNKKFILFDDSYYSGSTKKSIDRFLKKYNSKINKTFVLYDGNDKIDSNRQSLYRYYDYHNGNSITPQKLLNYLYDHNLNIPLENVEKMILNKQITSIRQLNIEINKILKKYNKNQFDINDYNRKDELKYEKLTVTKRIVEKDIIIEIVENINEGYNFNHYKRDLIINDEYKRKYQEIEKTIDNYLNQLNPFVGEYQFNNVNRTIKFNIKPTQHWYLKFFRKDFEDPFDKKSYVNPDLFEGIWLISNNIDILTKYVVNGTIKNDDHVLLKTKDRSKYTLSIVLKKVRRNIYDIIMISQFKGREYYDNKQRVFKFHPNGYKKINEKLGVNVLKF